MNMRPEREEENAMNEEQSEEHVELDPNHPDRFVRFGNVLIRQGVRFLSLLMVLVILFAIVDTAYTFYTKLTNPPFFILDVSELLAVFGAVLVVLIAIEIYTNITLYLTSEVINVKLVVATALMAVARKVIALDDKSLQPEYFFAYAFLGLSFGVVYWLLSTK